jgi:hypothetical protein
MVYVEEKVRKCAFKVLWRKNKYLHPMEVKDVENIYFW